MPNNYAIYIEMIEMDILWIYLIGLVYFAYEDYQYMSIPLLPAVIYCILMTLLGSLEGVIAGLGLGGLLFALEVFAIGDILIIVPTISLFGLYGVLAVLLAGLGLQICGLIIKKKKLPYIPFLLVVLCLLGGLKLLVLHHWNC